MLNNSFLKPKMCKKNNDCYHYVSAPPNTLS